MIPEQGNIPIYVREGVQIVVHNVTTSYYAENKNWEMFAVRSNCCVFAHFSTVVSNTARLERRVYQT